MVETPWDTQEIGRRLPHRHPILLVDRVDEVKAGERIVAVKNVTVTEDVFRGHFPGNPILPGVLIVEAMAQTAGLLITASVDDSSSLLPYLVGIDGAKFRRPVVPGDQLVIDVSLTRRRDPFWKFRAVTMVAGKRVAEADLSLSVVEGAR